MSRLVDIKWWIILNNSVCFIRSLFTKFVCNRVNITILRHNLTYFIIQYFREQHDAMRLYLAGNNKLISDYRITDADCVVIYKWLRNDLYVVSLDLRYNNITDDGIFHIAKLMQVSYLNQFILNNIPRRCYKKWVKCNN